MANVRFLPTLLRGSNLSLNKAVIGWMPLEVRLMSDFTQWLHAVFVGQFSIWLVLGFSAQFFFMMRFVVQWLASERAGRSVLPTSFWFYSVVGGFLILIYSIVRKDPVFITSSILGLFIYLRNIWLILPERR